MGGFQGFVRPRLMGSSTNKVASSAVGSTNVVGGGNDGGGDGNSGDAARYGQARSGTGTGGGGVLAVVTSNCSGVLAFYCL